MQNDTTEALRAVPKGGDGSGPSVALINAFAEAGFHMCGLARLRSGGPKMTITGLCINGVVCKWFDGGRLETGIFPLGSLLKEEF